MTWVDRCREEASRSGDAQGEQHRRELDALGLPAARTEAVALAVARALHVCGHLMGQADAAGGQPAMDLFVRQVNEALTEMARLAAKVKAQ